MTVYSLTETGGNAGCYGVFSSEEKATATAMKLIKEEWEYDDAEETIWDGFSKNIYYSDGQFEIWKHELDDAI